MVNHTASIKTNAVTMTLTNTAFTEFSARTPFLKKNVSIHYSHKHWLCLASLFLKVRLGNKKELPLYLPWGPLWCRTWIWITGCRFSADFLKATKKFWHFFICPQVNAISCSCCFSARAQRRAEAPFRPWAEFSAWSGSTGHDRDSVVFVAVKLRTCIWRQNSC